MFIFMVLRIEIVQFLWFPFLNLFQTGQRKKSRQFFVRKLEFRLKIQTKNNLLLTNLLKCLDDLYTRWGVC